MDFPIGEAAKKLHSTTGLLVSDRSPANFDEILAAR